MRKKSEQIFFPLPVLQVIVIAPAAATSAFPDTEKTDTGKHPAA